jgi:hypothetical protein
MERSVGLIFTSETIFGNNCFLADQRNLGMSMKVERSTVDQVKERFDVLKKKKEEKKKEYDIEQKMKEMGEEVNRHSRIICRF